MAQYKVKVIEAQNINGSITVQADNQTDAERMIIDIIRTYVFSEEHYYLKVDSVELVNPVNNYVLFNGNYLTFNGNRVMWTV